MDIPTLKFESLQGFLYMDGHGLFVWLAYGITLVVLGASVIWPRLQRGEIVRQEQQAQKRAEKQESS